MTTTQQIITTFTEQVDTNKEYTRAELSKILTQVFNDVKNEGKPAKKAKKPKKEEDGEEKCWQYLSHREELPKNQTQIMWKT